MATFTTTTDRPGRAASLPCRRRLLTGALVGVGIAGPARIIPAALGAATPREAGGRFDPDRRLLDACSAFQDLERDVRNRHAGHLAVLSDQAPLIDLIADHRATTLRGLQRKAQTIACWADDLLDASPLWDRRLTASLLRDLIASDISEAPPVTTGAEQSALRSHGAGWPRRRDGAPA